MKHSHCLCPRGKGCAQSQKVKHLQNLQKRLGRCSTKLQFTLTTPFSIKLLQWGVWYEVILLRCSFPALQGPRAAPLGWEERGCRISSTTLGNTQIQFPPCASPASSTNDLVHPSLTNWLCVPLNSTWNAHFWHLWWHSWLIQNADLCDHSENSFVLGDVPGTESGKDVVSLANKSWSSGAFVLNDSMQRKRQKEQAGSKRFYNLSSHSQEIRQTKYGHRGSGLQCREIIAIIQFLCWISNTDIWINTSHYFPSFMIYRRGNKHLIAAQNTFHWNITLINAKWHRVLICLFLIGNHSVQNLNEPLGSDHRPQARLSCFVFAACGSSLIWVSGPHSGTVF